MAAISLSVARGVGIDYVEGSGSQTVTVAANAPAAGDIEVRFSSAALAAGLTSREAREAVNIIFRYILDALVKGGTAIWPNV